MNRYYLFFRNRPKWFPFNIIIHELLFDIGHAQMANENPADMIALAGDRLAYVHLDDNDGENDLHLSLCDGVLTEDVLQSTFTALHSANYTGNMSLELKPDIPEPLDALKRSRTIVLKNQL